MHALLILSLLGLPIAAQALPGWSPDCEVKDGLFVLELGRTKTPTHAVVILPDGRMLRLRYAPEGVDTLGPDYGKGRLRVPLGDLVGVDVDLQREKVFTAPGTYRFVLQDANTAEGMDLHRVECSVILTESQLTPSGT